MATSVRVPRADRPVFSWLATAPQDLFDQVLDAWSKPKAASRSRLLGSIDHIELSEVTAEQLVDAMLGLAVFRFAHSEDVEDLAAYIPGSPDIGVSPSDAGQLSRRIAEILVLPPIVLAAKAIDLRADHGSLFHTCRIYSDVRPVFDEDPTREPQGAVAFHVLKLEYLRNEQFESIYMTMTDSDLQRLSDQVNRALVKRETLHKYLSSLDLTVVDPEGD